MPAKMGTQGRPSGALAALGPRLILRTWRTLEIAIPTYICPMPCLCGLWLKAVRAGARFRRHARPRGEASLSHAGAVWAGLSGERYSLHICWQSGSRAASCPWASRQQPLLNSVCGFQLRSSQPVILIHGSGRLLASLLKGQSPEAQETQPRSKRSSVLVSRE
jgi:hypothetical protein